eukprot:jgi/Chlat1/3286/Chrsp22S03535
MALGRVLGAGRVGLRRAWPTGLHRFRELMVASSSTLSSESSIYRRHFSSSAAPPPPPPPPGPATAAAPVSLQKLHDNFLDGTSSTYLESLEKEWAKDPSSVHPTWRTVFDSLKEGTVDNERYRAFSQAVALKAASSADIRPDELGKVIQESMRLLLLVRAYQVQGHMIANLDPLGLTQPKMPAELDPALYGFSDADMDRKFFLGTWRMKGLLHEQTPVRTLRSILERLKRVYSGNIGFEYMHIPDRDRCNWLRERIEDLNHRRYGKAEKEVLLDRLMWGTEFESFLESKWTSAKRFGLEGGETLIPGMKALIDRSADLGVESVVIGMPHRGRLNVLANVVRKPMAQIFSEFSKGVAPIKSEDPAQFIGSGDVKYHLGTSYDRPTRGGKRVHLSLIANPSHLEAVDPVVEGKTRAKQYFSQDFSRDKNMAVLLHGDGSFAGQGVVFETFDMSNLPEYTTGGTVHIVVNNQVAFTTDPKYSRSSAYCTDVAKALNAPIFHVNGDDPEAVQYVCELAAEWRQRWKEDVVIDIVCYRKFGHNEIDEPSFTQPLLYQRIRSHTPALSSYSKKLIDSGEFTDAEVKAMDDRVRSILNEEFENSKTYTMKDVDWLASHWKGFRGPGQLSRIRNTGVPKKILEDVGRAITTLPEGFSAHRALKRVYEARRQMIETGEGIDWGTAEALAFGTLLVEGNHVRLSGQDVERGTFSHRHSVVHDQKTGERYIPLSHVVPDAPPGLFTVCNSSLSEFGVLGFELGYSMESPNSLVLWEAQFGDFANGAQVIIDQFLSCGEAKWLRQTGLVCLLPHGYDGQGPEHSSARLERFLQLADDNPAEIPPMDPSVRTQLQQCNWQVCNVTTPANYFHVLRRQIHRDFRKPLIIMSPKNLLRHPKVKSHITEFDDEQGHPDWDKQGTRFKRIIKDKGNHQAKETGFKRLVLCSGKVYYELDELRESLGLNDTVAICRVEQICPFPWDLIQREIRRYEGAEIVWAQEEPMNMGAWSYVFPRMHTVLKGEGRSIDELRYVGRLPAASPATGYLEQHKREQTQLVKEAVTLE